MNSRNSRSQSSKLLLVILLLMQSVYSGAEYGVELEVDALGHLIFSDQIHTELHDHHEPSPDMVDQYWLYGDQHRSDHFSDHYSEHPADPFHDGHCHGQIHTFLSPVQILHELANFKPVNGIRPQTFYFSLDISPELRPPAKAA